MVNNLYEWFVSYFEWKSNKCFYFKIEKYIYIQLYTNLSTDGIETYNTMTYQIIVLEDGTITES